MTAEHGTPDFPQFEDLLSGYEELRVHGHFDKRRTDLLSITGTGRTESVHSDVVAWLLDPTGSHGLRSSSPNAWYDPALSSTPPAGGATTRSGDPCLATIADAQK